MRRRQRNAIDALRQRQLESIVDGPLPMRLRCAGLPWILGYLQANEADLPIRFRLSAARKTRQ
jgi:hypothetical protein